MPCLAGLESFRPGELRTEVQAAVEETARNQARLGPMENLRAIMAEVLDEMVPLDLAPRQTVAQELAFPGAETLSSSRSPVASVSPAGIARFIT